VLAFYDPHGTGQQLAWRDRGGSWKSRTRGRIEDGFFADEAPGDRIAAIALARPAGGEQHGWVVLTGTETEEYPLPVRMARLSDLDDRRGPRVGRAVTVQATAGGNARADIAFERGPRGRRRGGDLVVAPHGGRLLQAHGGVVRSAGLRHPPSPPRHSVADLPQWLPDADACADAAGRPPGGNHGARAPPPVRAQQRGAPAQMVEGTRPRAGGAVGPPSAVGLAPGVLAAAAGPSGGVVIVKLSSSGDEARAVRRLGGRTQPVMTASRRRAWLFMVRSRDDALVSRSFRLGAGWSARDRVELPGASRRLAWPNAARTARRGLRLVLQGRTCPTTPKAHEVIAFDRRIGRK
jgi:hypothetical protein